MQLVYLPGAGIIMLLKDLRKIVKDKKNKSKLSRLCRAVCLFIVRRFIVIM